MTFTGDEEADLDRIYKRTEQSIDLSDVKTKKDLRRSVLEKQVAEGNMQNWSEKLSRAVWKKIKQKRQVKADKFIAKSQKNKSTVHIGSTARKVFQAIYNKATKKSYIAARNIKTGRFTKYTKQQLYGVITK